MLDNPMDDRRLYDSPASYPLSDEELFRTVIDEMADRMLEFPHYPNRLVVAMGTIKKHTDLGWDGVDERLQRILEREVAARTEELKRIPSPEVRKTEELVLFKRELKRITDRRKRKLQKLRKLANRP